MYKIQIIRKNTEPKPIKEIDRFTCKDFCGSSGSQYSGEIFEPFPKEVNKLPNNILKQLESKDEIIYEYTETVQIKISKIIDE